MNTNSYLEKGSAHDVCQDYVLTGKINDNISYLIVSDGCSSSHQTCKQVDLGARILSYCARKLLIKDLESMTSLLYGREDFSKFFGRKVIDEANKISKELMLHPQALDATLLICVSDKERSLVLMYGDGGLIVHRTNGNIYYNEISFISGAPYYLSYYLDQERENMYSEEFSLEPLVVTNYEIRTSCEDPVVHTQVINNNTKINPSIYPKLSYEIKEASIITLVSDGVKSFQCFPDGGSMVEISSMEIIKEISAFKNTQGNFVERRLTAMKRKFDKDKVIHYDDLSVVSIILTEKK